MSKCFTNYVTCINASDIVQTLINRSHHWIFILLVFTPIHNNYYLPTHECCIWLFCEGVQCIAQRTCSVFHSEIFPLFRAGVSSVCFASFGIVAIKLNAQIDMKNIQCGSKKSFALVALAAVHTAIYSNTSGTRLWVSERWEWNGKSANTT